MILTTCPAPARAALSMTLISCAGTPGLTSTTLATPFIASSMVSGAVEISLGDLRPGLGQGPRFLQVPHQRADGDLALPEQAYRLGPHLAGRARDQDHDCLSLLIGFTSPLLWRKNGLSSPKLCYLGGMADRTPARTRLTPKGERTRARIVNAAAQLIYERRRGGHHPEDVKAAAGVERLATLPLFRGQGRARAGGHRPPGRRHPPAHRAGRPRHPGGTPGLARPGHRPRRPAPVARAGAPRSLGGQLAETDAQARAQVAAGFGRWSAALTEGIASAARRRPSAARHRPR